MLDRREGARAIYATQEIFGGLQSSGVEVDILVDNAGHGFHGKWWELQCYTESAGVSFYRVGRA